MLARFQTQARGGVMRGVRCGDVDHVDVRVRGELGPRAVGARDVVALREALRRFGGTGTDRDELGIGYPGEVFGEDTGDGTGGEDSPAYIAHDRHPRTPRSSMTW